MDIRTKIILELGCNHNGNFDIAKKMIEAAAKLGVWAVKFQKRDPDSMSEGEKLIPRNPENSFGVNYYEHRKALEFTVDQIIELKQRADNLNLVQIVSVFDLVSAEQMVDAGFDFIKLPSQFYSNYALNNYLLKWAEYRRKYFIVSTGMHSFQEIINWQFFDKPDITMYCRSMYPLDFTDLNLEVMRKLAYELRKSDLAYSSHEKNGEGIGMAVLLGAKYVERHFILDKNMKGSDHKTVSSDPLEIIEIKDSIKKIEDILYSNDNSIDINSIVEKKIRKTYRGF